MLVGVLNKGSLADVRALLERMDVSSYDALELRLDTCSGFNLEELAAICFPLPVIFTLRAACEGGQCRMEEAERLALLEQLAEYAPAYLDVESFVPVEFVSKLSAKHPDLSFVISRHDFEKTPEDLEAVLAEMAMGRECNVGSGGKIIYKIATFARSGLDSLRMLAFCKRVRDRGGSIVGICMGPDGESTRILAPVVHHGFCYCPVEESSAPGQIDSATLRSLYNFRSLDANTAIYGLLGDPVARSVGHHYHNERNIRAEENAVYVKWRLGCNEIEWAMPLLREIGVRGLSITMPLKDEVTCHLSDCDDVVTAIGAANTLVLRDNGWYGANTDGQGALEPLPDVTDKKIAVLGMGGAARSIMYELIRRHVAKLVVYNRTVRDISFSQGVDVRPLTDACTIQQTDYDIIINALPFSLTFPFNEIRFKPGSLALDISYGGDSMFLNAARSAGCIIIDGAAMFTGQARLQRSIWGCKLV